jgi:hypothetical protein
MTRLESRRRLRKRPELLEAGVQSFVKALHEPQQLGSRDLSHGCRAQLTSAGRLLYSRSTSCSQVARSALARSSRAQQSEKQGWHHVAHGRPRTIALPFRHPTFQGRATDGCVPAGQPIQKLLLEEPRRASRLRPSEMSSTRHCVDILPSQHTSVSEFS